MDETILTALERMIETDEELKTTIERMAPDASQLSIAEYYQRLRPLVHSSFTEIIRQQAIERVRQCAQLQAVHFDILSTIETSSNERLFTRDEALRLVTASKLSENLVLSGGGNDGECVDSE